LKMLSEEEQEGIWNCRDAFHGVYWQNNNSWQRQCMFSFYCRMFDFVVWIVLMDWPVAENFYRKGAKNMTFIIDLGNRGIRDAANLKCEKSGMR